MVFLSLPYKKKKRTTKPKIFHGELNYLHVNRFEHFFSASLLVMNCTTLLEKKEKKGKRIISHNVNCVHVLMCMEIVCM